MGLTPRIVAYVGHEEGLVREAYKDSKGIWTWAMGVAATGHNNVLRFKDRPQPIEDCLAASIDLIKAQYLPPVLAAFGRFALSEPQLAAALSFEWNTGEIEKAIWVRNVVAGDMAKAEANIMKWTDHGLLTDRREREQALFFHATWPKDMRMPVYAGVSRPSYSPINPRPFDAMLVLQQIMGGR